ncbi:hypothetical protein TYRP_016324 [Tyrophagus putrescentiae]|nr:hypothetical protein TYRP_016324 [Tyrophagus putrescentiae]
MITLGTRKYHPLIIWGLMGKWPAKLGREVIQVTNQFQQSVVHQHPGENSENRQMVATRCSTSGSISSSAKYSHSGRGGVAAAAAASASNRNWPQVESTTQAIA